MWIKAFIQDLKLIPAKCGYKSTMVGNAVKSLANLIISLLGKFVYKILNL